MSEAEHEAPPPPPPPAVKKRVVPIVIAGATIAIITLIGALYARARASVNDVALASEPKGVTVVRARASTFQARRTYVGTIEPWHQAKIGPQLVSAYVDSVLVRPGARVKRKDVLATLDCRNASASTQAVAAEARSIDARQRALASESRRMDELFQGKFVSENEVEQKRSQSAAASAQLDALRAKLAGKSLEESDCVLRSPFDGEIAARWIDPGSFVRPGTAVVSVVDRSTIRLTSLVPEVDYGVVSPGKGTQIRLLALGRETTGIIARRAPSADPSTRTVSFEIDLSDPERTIPTGTTAEIMVDAGDPIPATEIPITAAKVRGAKATIFVIVDGVAKSANYKVIGERGGSLFVAPDLPADAQVVTQGRGALADGDRVVAKLDAFEPQKEAPAGGNQR